MQPEAPSALAWTGLVGDACWVLNALVHRHQPAGVRSLAERGSSSPYSLVFSLACVPPLGAACRSSSLLSLPSSSAVGSAAAVAASSMCTELGRLWRTVWHVARWREARHLTLRHLTLPCRGQWFASGLLGPGRKLSRVTFSLLACPSDSLGSAPLCWMRLLDVCAPGSPELIRRRVGCARVSLSCLYQLVQRHSCGVNVM